MIAVLGVDGGQSAIRLRHSGDNHIVEVAGVSRQEGDAIAAVADAVAEAWRRRAFQPVGRVVLGLTTAPTITDEQDRLCALVSAATGAGEVWLADDAVTSHAGALSGEPGVSLIAGTGVACLAAVRKGAPRIIGGHGYLLGDEGGAFWIGRQGLGAVLRARDGRAAGTALTELAERRFGDLADLHVRLHDAARPVNEIAQFARDVMAAAAANDVAADDILQQAARELHSVARAGVEWVGGNAVPLALGGRLLETGTELRRRLDEVLATDPLATRPRSADETALDGAIRLGCSGDRRLYGGLVHVWTEPAST